MKKIKETIEQILHLNETQKVAEKMPQVTNQEVNLLNSSRKNFPKKYFVYIPENLCVDELIQNNPVDIPHFHKDKLIYIISLIYSIPIRLKDYDFEDENGFIPINSEVAKSRVREYDKYLEYLVNTRVFEKREDYKYLAGGKSSGYRFTEIYNTAPKRTFITWKRLIKAICKINKKEEEIFVDTYERPLEYLEKWWNDKIQFDYYGAKKWLDEQLIKEQAEGKQHCKEKYHVRKLVIEKFRNRDYILHQDATTGRVHSLLTQLKSELRQFIKYDGKTLVAVDITNSQPFLAMALLNQNTYSKNMKERLRIYNNRQDINSSIMLTLSNQEFENNKDLQEFKHFVSSGKFYEMFGDLLVKNGLEQETDPKKLRKITKKIMFASMFGHNNEKCKVKIKKDNKKTGQVKYIPNTGMILFKETFPTVFEIFRTIKMGKHNTLACMLQNLEAELVLHSACKIISEENPNVPLFTLHDSIVTTEENAKYVQRVLSDVLLNAIGIAPTINYEEWILKEKVA